MKSASPTLIIISAVLAVLGVASLVTVLVVRNQRAATVEKALSYLGDCKTVAQDEPLDLLTQSACKANVFGKSEWWCPTGITPDKDPNQSCVTY